MLHPNLSELSRVHRPVQTNNDDENPYLCGEPTDWPYAWRRESVGGNVQQPGNDKQPSLDCRQRAFGTSCMHQKQGEGLRKYLKQVTVRPNEAPADARNLAVHHETLGPKCRLANGVSARSIG